MTSARIFTGVLLIAAPLVFTAGFTGLQMTFDYPDILRHPASEVLARFAAAGPELHLSWYAMMAASLAFIPASIGAGWLLRERDGFVAALSAGFGVVAGLVQALGLIRWVMLTPVLAAAYTAPDATEAAKANATAIFDAANAYLGVGVGEHLGYLFTALWTVTLAILLRRPVFGGAGALIALGVAAGMAEPFGVAWAADVNAIAYSAWALWTLVAGVLLMWPQRRPAAAMAAA